MTVVYPTWRSNFQFSLLPPIAVVDPGVALLLDVVMGIGFSRQIVEPVLGTVGGDAKSLLHLSAGDGVMLAQVVIEEGDDLLTGIGMVWSCYTTAVDILCRRGVLELTDEAGVGRKGDTLHLDIACRNHIGIGEVWFYGMALFIVLHLQPHSHLERPQPVNAEAAVVAQLLNNLVLENDERRLHHGGVIGVVHPQMVQESLHVHGGIRLVTHLVSGVPLLVGQRIRIDGVVNLM